MKKYFAKGMNNMLKAAKNTVNYATGKSSTKNQPAAAEEEKKAATEEVKE